ncbi:response regulator [Umezakia ovalisporum]|uniref:Protein PatA n=1 Tax=Umezakia ovalisporum FSS-43 TaxID=2740520 RepID=A0ABT6K2Q2_9CYAN|nr:response regulator [Umezakia ovalisporum]MDH6056639.1 response regulator [Umezakia ovalisporum FSS-43]MDH6070179.1 response regulator [Umezakia ovalisporum CobakiLakeA]MDH6075943.1 response regulator [Umezakia ovalisporum CS-1034]MDH6079908.1 response regulator [Umezakia ovalisporum FSS-44]MDH6094199.1 response regulator [Umezakia ovalisporum CobakiLakeB]
MKTLPISRYRFFQKLQPISLLKKITSKTVNGCLQVFSTSGSWLIYIEQGKLIYACYSDQMFEPLYRHLQSLSQQISTIPNGIDEQLQVIFQSGIDEQAIPNPDYLAICWLVSQEYITPVQAGMLIEKLALEVLETFLSLEEGSYEFIPESFLDDMPKYCHLSIRLLVEQCQRGNRERSYKATLPAARLNQPQPQTPPIKKSPRVSEGNHAVYSHNNTDKANKTTYSNPGSIHNIHKTYNSGQRTTTPADKKHYKVFCIDDSPTVLKTIQNYLDEQIFSVITITDSLNALMQILQIKPDIILLDIEMPNLDGYELCSLLRKHPSLKSTPIIMVSARTGLLDRARVKLVRASGFLAKPFIQGDLLKIIFQHIS